MTKKDYQLIHEALDVHYSEWWRVEDLIEKAESDEAKVTLKRIETGLYHTEEFECDNL